jgi:Xaa-Pro aminopeptidase
VPAEAAIVREKLDQAPAILAEHGVDVWLTLVRETLLTRDPSLDLVAGTYCAWQSAFVLSRSGERVAIVGRHDAASVEQLDAYHEVAAYDESIRPGLRETIERLAPESIALNYSASDPAADGLTHGLWLVFRDALEGTPYVDRVVSSAPVVNSLRGRKSASELARICAAVAETEAIFALVGSELRAGLKETEIAALLHAQVSRRGLGYAWEPSHCPAVNAGPDKDVGHSPPGELTTQRGQLLHCDFGVEKAGYCSDLQRVWYVLDDGESGPPADVRTAWEAVWAAVDAGAAALRPGAVGHEVDAAARTSLVAAGFPEPKYALGHQLGRSAHDGGTILGPPWDRYGEAPFGTIEEGNVFTLEYGAPVPGRGYVGLEEDVLVTSNGLEWLSTPQRELWLVTS